MPGAEIATVEALLGATGADLGSGDWFEVTQEQVDQFARLTGDCQFIHVDPLRAAAETDFGGTIVHGYFALSLQPMLCKTQRTLKITIPHRSIVFYGLNKVRFLTPMKIPARLKISTKLGDVRQISDQQIEVVFQHSIALEGAERPAVYAEAIDRYFI
jgi:acyl dehydratase